MQRDDNQWSAKDWYAWNHRPWNDKSQKWEHVTTTVTESRHSSSSWSAKDDWDWNDSWYGSSDPIRWSSADAASDPFRAPFPASYYKQKPALEIGNSAEGGTRGGSGRNLTKNMSIGPAAVGSTQHLSIFSCLTCRFIYGAQHPIS